MVVEENFYFFLKIDFDNMYVCMVIFNLNKGIKGMQLICGCRTCVLSAKWT